MGPSNTLSETIPVTGMLLLIMVSFLWGGNMVSIKISNLGVPPVMAATIRSGLAAFLIWTYARSVAETILLRADDFKHGVVGPGVPDSGSGLF